MKKLKIWLLADGETLPTTPNAKKMRAWMLGEVLSSRGHEVIWWSSNFLHIKKLKISEGDLDIKINDSFKAKLLDCGTYKKNICFKRILYHIKLGRKFYKTALNESLPDIIIASYPIIEVSFQSIKFSQKFNIPVIIDVRDMWPDIFLKYFSSYFLKVPVYIASKIFNYKVSRTFQKAVAIVSMSEDVLRWGLSKIKNADHHKNFASSVFYIGYDESINALERVEVKPVAKIDKRKVIFCYLGVFGSSYDIEKIIEAAHLLQSEKNSLCHFIMGGEGPEKEKIKDMAKGLKNITFLDWLEKNELKYVLENSDVSLIPTPTTAFPNKVFEALFFGLPILHCMNGEVKERLKKEKAGIFYEKDSLDSLLEAIKYMSTNPSSLKEMKENAKNFYKKYFERDKIYNNYCDFLESVERNYR